MTQAVQHHLRDRALAVVRFGGRLVINGLGQAVDRPGPIDVGAGEQLERPRGGVRGVGDGHGGVDRQRVLRRDIGAELERLRGRRDLGDLGRELGRHAGHGAALSHVEAEQTDPCEKVQRQNGKQHERSDAVLSREMRHAQCRHSQSPSLHQILRKSAAPIKPVRFSTQP